MKNKTIKSNPARGMRDYLPDEARLRFALIEVIEKVYARFGYRRIDAPALEDFQTLVGSDAGENDKLIFRVMKRGEQLNKAYKSGNVNELADLGLRYDLTVPLIRAVVNNRAQLPNVLKTIQIGPVWRAERPQRGRLRQFMQCDIDVVGEAGPWVEIELIEATAEALHDIGLAEFVIRLNDRRILNEMVKSAGFQSSATPQVLITLDKLDKIGRAGVERELKNSSLDQQAVNSFLALITKIPSELSDTAQVIDFLAEFAPDNYLKNLCEIRDWAKEQVGDTVSLVLDPTLVRGMGYYTGPIFEISYGDYPFSIAGGGRYDKMAETMFGTPLPACGFSLGFERILQIVREERLFNVDEASGCALLYTKGVQTDCIFGHVAELRAMGLTSISIYPQQRNLSRQLNELKELGFSEFCVVNGDGSRGSVRPLRET